MSLGNTKEFEAAQLREPPLDTTGGDQPTQLIGGWTGPAGSTPPVQVVTIPQVMETQRLRRQRYSKKSIREWLENISNSVLADAYISFHEHHLEFDFVCAGARHHHWWRGGMADHVKEMIGYALDLYDLYPGDLSQKVTKDDIIIACYLHDFAKIWMYEEISDEDRERNPKKYLEQQLFKPVYGAFDIVDEESKTLLELSKFGIVPTEAQWSAVLFAEGGYADRNFAFGGRPTRTGDTVMSRNPLAVIVHMADMYSSQVLGRSIA
jgi:hypothetical protein